MRSTIPTKGIHPAILAKVGRKRKMCVTNIGQIMQKSRQTAQFLSFPAGKIRKNRPEVNNSHFLNRK